jgi:poly-gamma-glutamate capsule biosynthesis protein CapA/YwtB (metallophosphatase superfamily)
MKGFSSRRIAALVGVLAAVGAGAVALSETDGGRPPVSDRDRRPAKPKPSKKPPRTVRLTVSASGDLLIHGPVFQRALAYGRGSGYDFRPLFRTISPWVRRADLALCHVETPLSSGPPRGYPSFSTPASLARAISRTGWDACSTASNHSLDAGQGGIESTILSLDRAGIRHTGSYRRAAGARTVLTFRIKGVKVAVLAYTETTNGNPLPKPWSLNLARRRRIIADARKARRRGARVVLVNVHWGPPEYTPRPAPRQFRLARSLARSPSITAVLGQGPHVVWPIRWLAGKPVVFSEGNLVSNQTAACCSPAAQDGLIAILHIRVRGNDERVERVRYLPTWVRHPDFTVLPVGPAMRRGLANPAELRASYARTVETAGRGRRKRPIPRRPP